LLLLLMLRPPPRPTLFPYTTLFRSRKRHRDALFDQPSGGNRRIARSRGDVNLEAKAGCLQGTGEHGEQAQGPPGVRRGIEDHPEDRKSTRLNSSHVKISYAVFCLKK